MVRSVELCIYMRRKGVRGLKRSSIYVGEEEIAIVAEYISTLVA